MEFIAKALRQYWYGTGTGTDNINSSQGPIMTYDLNGNRTSDTHYGEQVTQQDQTGFDESGNPIIVSSGYASRTGAITEYYQYDRMSRLASVATGGFDASLQPRLASQAIVLDARSYDGAGRLVRSGPAGGLHCRAQCRRHKRRQRRAAGQARDQSTRQL